MKAKPSNPSVEVEKDLSWMLFLAICAGVLLPLWFVGYYLVYTEGEVMHVMFRGMTVLAAAAALLRRKRQA